mgnify:FL=1
MKNVKTLTATILLGIGLLVGGCGNNQPAQQLVQLDNGQYTMSTGDDYGVVYLKGYSDNQVANYKMVRIIGKDAANVATVDDLKKYIDTNKLLALANIQYIGDAAEYKGNVYQSVNAGTHIYVGQKLIAAAKDKDDQKITFDGEFKQYALCEATKVERNASGHLTHYTLKVVKDMKVVDNHMEVNE